MDIVPRRGRGRPPSRGRGRGRAQSTTGTPQSQPQSQEIYSQEVSMTSAPPPPAPAPAPAPVPPMQGQAEDFISLVRQIVQTTPTPVAPPAPQPAPVTSQADRLEKMLSLSARLGVAHYEGTEDLFATQEWIASMEGLFRLSECQPEDRVTFTEFMLRGSVRAWWARVVRSRGDTERPTWQYFLDQFQAQYISEVQRRELQRQFLDLKQEERSVEAYRLQFERLEIFSLDSMATTAERARRFHDGLHPLIQGKLGHVSLSAGYDILLEEALKAEVTLRRESLYWAGQQGHTGSYYGVHPPRTVMGPPSQQQPRQVQSHSRGSQQTSQASNKPADTSGSKRKADDVPTCPECGKHHRGECRREKRSCFYCRKPGHIERECYKKKRDEKASGATSSRGGQHQAIPGDAQQSRAQVPQQQTATARVYAITPAAAPAATDVISGMKLLHDESVCVLIDPDSIHSCI